MYGFEENPPVRQPAPANCSASVGGSLDREGDSQPLPCSSASSPVNREACAGTVHAEVEKAFAQICPSAARRAR